MDFRTVRYVDVDDHDVNWISCAADTMSDKAAMEVRRKQEERKAQRHETLNILEEIATLLNTTLDREGLAHCVRLIEMGVDPEALANIVSKLLVQHPRNDSTADGKM